MKKYNIQRPYEGEEPYIFVSYCHDDADSVYPVIRRLTDDGYRVWYDDGITPGDEWPETIARHLNCADAVIAFISENSVNSHNCRKEINFAVLKGKDVVSVFIENVRLSLGMEMQLSSQQSLFLYKYEKFDDFFGKLYEMPKLKPCREEKLPEPPVAPSNPSQGGISWERKTQREKEKTTLYPSQGGISWERKTVFSLVRKSSLQKVRIYKSPFVVGRKRELCDYVISGNKTVGRQHAIITVENDECFISDNNSLNGVYVNGKAIASEPSERFKLKNHDDIRLGSEHFILVKDIEEEVMKNES